MPLKIKNQNGEWVVDQKAIETSIMDVEGNFTSDNVEGALRELAEEVKQGAKLSEIEEKVEKNRVNIESLKGNVSTINTNIVEIQDDIEWLKVNGGSGGGSAIPTITSTFTDCSIEKGKDIIIPLFFSSPSQGAGTAYIVINNIEVDTVGVSQGNNSIKVLGTYLTSQTNNLVAIYVKDRAGIVSNQLTWNVIAGGIELSSTFDYGVDYGITDTIRVPYNIDTGINDIITLYLDVDNVVTEHVAKNGYNFIDIKASELGLGTHPVKLYAKVNKYTSKVISFNLVIVSTTELYLSTTFEDNQTFTYGELIQVMYRLSKVSTEEFNVTLKIDGTINKTRTVTVGTYPWTIEKLGVGSHILTIEATSLDYSEVKTLTRNINIAEGEYTPVEDYTLGLICDLNAVGKSNEDNNVSIWKDNSGNGHNAELVNFNFGTNGFVNDTLVCDNDAYVVIPWSPWSTNALNGSTIDIIYTPINSGIEDCRVIDYTEIIDDLSIEEIKPFKGLFADVLQSISASASSGTSAGKINLDDESGEIHLTWVLDRNNKFLKTYINGVLSRIMFLTDSGTGVNKFYEDFSHDNYIYLNSTKGKNCGTNNIHRFRVYDHALTSDEVLQNHIANIRDLQVQKEVYNFNYKNSTLPKMYLTGDTTNMTHKETVPMRIEYVSPNEEKFGASFNSGIQNNPVRIQGTSSLAYVRKNYTIFLKDEYGKDMMYNPYGNGSVADNVFCLKCDYVESSHANNTGMAKFINDCVYDTKTPAQLSNPNCRTTINGFPIEVYMNGEFMGIYNLNHDRYSYKSYGYDYVKYPNMLVYEINSNSNVSAGAFYRYGDNAESSANISELEYYKRDFNLIYGNRTTDSDSYSEIKTLVEWVSVAEQDLFRETISERFNKEYLFRYFLVTLMIGGVDSLGKNLKITTYDGKIWYPTFYDLDTVLGIDNSGYLTIPPDVEIESGSFNTSNSNLWSKVWNYFNQELKEEWAKMRQSKFTLKNLMSYIEGEQISKIPSKMYNDDAQVKYLNFGSLYTYCCHGNKKHQITRWLRERIAYIDSMLGFFTSQEDQVTIRLNKTGYVSFEVTPYVPLYFSVKWSNAKDGVQTFKLKRGETKTFYYTSTTSTDQEVIIYHAQHIKKIENISNLNPSSCILSNAKKLTNVEIHSSNLYNIDVTNNTFLRSINLRNCSKLGTVTATGSSLNLSKCKYLKFCDVYNTALTEVQLNSSGGSLTEIYYPKTIQSIQLIKQRLLEVIGVPYGYDTVLKDSSKWVKGRGYDTSSAPSPNSLYKLSNESMISDDKYCYYNDFIEFNYSEGVKISPVNLSANVSAIYYKLFVTVCLYDSNKHFITRLTYYAYMSGAKGLNYFFDTSSYNTAKYIKIGLSYTNSINTGNPPSYSKIEDCINDYVFTQGSDNPIFDQCTSLYTINIQECPSIKKLNTSTDPEIAKSFKAMTYCNNLTIRNSLDLTVLKFDGFYRLRNVVIENMYNLEQIGFNNLLPIGDVSTIKYIGMSNCPKLSEVQLNCTSNNYEITFADNSILNFGKLSSLRSITSNCVLKGLKTIVVPTALESMFFTNEYGSGYSTIENIWVSSVCDVNTDGTSPVVTHINNTYKGIDFAGMNLKNIDLGALVKIPRAINFSLSPTTVNPHFNLNRDGSTYPYLKPEGTLDLSNYTESLARFFDGVDLDKLQIICNNNLPQTDLSYCFYNSSFSNNISINKLLSRVSSITNLDYCFYRTTINSVDILNSISMGASSTMNYTFAECPNITSLANVSIPNNVVAVSGMFSGCPLTSITNITVNVNGSISGLFKGCSNLATINTLRIPNVTDVSSVFDGCTNLVNLSGFELPSTCTNVSNLFNGCYNLTQLGIDFGSNIVAGDNWYPPNLEILNNTTINTNYVKLTNCTTLKTINNLVLNVSTVENFLTGTTGLKNINGFTVGGTLTSVAGLFKDKTLITANRFTFGNTITDFTSCFENCQGFTNETVINIPNTGTKTMNFSRMFYGCLGITSISNATYPSNNSNLTSMYQNCTNLISLNNLTINSSLLTNMFNGCTALNSVSGLIINNATSLQGMFYGCTLLPSISFIIPDTCTNISGLFEGCTSLLDISGMTFGSGITTTTNWGYGANIVDANNISINNEFVNFRDFTRLVNCRNLYCTAKRVNLLFNQCTSLVDVSGLTLTRPEVMGDIGEQGTMISGTNALTVIDFANCNLDNLKDIQYFGYNKGKLFKNFKISSSITSYYGCFNSWNTYFENLTIDCNTKIFRGLSWGISTFKNVIITSNVTDLSDYFNGCSSLTEISFSPNCNSINVTSLNLMFYLCNKLNIVDFTNFNFTNVLDYSNMFLNCYNAPFSNITGLIIGGKATNCSGMFQNCYFLKNDIIFPANVTNVSGCFKGSGVTHIRSNWNTTYTNTITATDCYSGCTAITHCDGVDLEVNQYVSGLDEVPTAWGGYGFNKSNTGIFEIEITTANTTVSFSSALLLWDKKINWGDGYVTVNEYSHTYVNVGTYIIKGNTPLSGSGVGRSSLITTNLRKVIQLPTAHTNYLASFNPSNITYANLSGLSPTNTSEMFKGCSKLITIDGINKINTSNVTDMNNMFNGCSSLTSLDLSTWNTSNVTTMSNMFNGCSSLTSLDLSNWNTSNVTTMSYMFYGCSSLTSLNLSNWNTSNVTDMSYMFYGCSSLTDSIVNSFKLLNFSNVTTLESLFKKCTSITTVDFSNCNFSKLIYIGGLCNGCSSLNYFYFPTTNCTKISYMGGCFENCLKIKVVDNFNLSNLNNIALASGERWALWWFTYVYSVDMSYALDITFLGKLTSGSAEKWWSMMVYYGMDSYGCLQKLTATTLVNLFTNNLSDYSASTTKPTLRISSANIAKLTTAQIKIATDKGWTLV